MKRPSYKRAVLWIALNDDAGANAALDLSEVRVYITTLFVADLFGVDSEQVARDVIKVRRREYPDVAERYDESVIQLARLARGYLEGER